jgi:hypothetical protein
MSVAVATETIELSISEIEDRLADLGYETDYYGDDDGTQFYIRIGDKEITIADAVSGDYFRPENVTYASYFFGDLGKDLTEKFADVESIHDFVAVVREAMDVSFLPR